MTDDALDDAINSAGEVTAVFVYGTLKQGECRARYWPRQPRSIDIAYIAGRLYDLGPYPALVPGNDRVRGELWQFDAADMQETLRVLDDVEGYTQLGDDYYRRIIVVAETPHGKQIAAYAYEFVRPNALASKPAVGPDEGGACSWHGDGRIREVD